jgi:hypothetical protein
LSKFFDNYGEVGFSKASYTAHCLRSGIMNTENNQGGQGGNSGGGKDGGKGGGKGGNKGK